MPRFLDDSSDGIGRVLHRKTRDALRQFPLQGERARVRADVFPIHLFALTPGIPPKAAGNPAKVFKTLASLRLCVFALIFFGMVTAKPVLQNRDAPGRFPWR